MTGILFTLLAVILAGLGGRDQATVAALAERQGRRPGLLAVAIAASLITAAIASWAAFALIPTLTGKVRLIPAALALGLAGAEMLILSPPRKPSEPTRSLGAAALVLLAQQMVDSARFLVFAIAVATAAPLLAGIGGAVGGAVSLTAAWLAPEVFADPRLRLARRVIAVGMLMLALVLGFRVLA